MYLVLKDTSEKLQLISSAAADLDVVLTYIDCSDATPPVPSPPENQLTNINSATTTDILAVPGSNKRRSVKSIFCRNAHASTACDVTILIDDGGTDYELHKVTLVAGECLEFLEGVGFFHLKLTSKLDRKLRVTSDVVNATTSFADVTGLTQAVEAGKTYAFEAHLYHQTNATTTGSRFGVNGPASPTVLIAGQDSGQTPGIAATNIAIGVATAYDTALSASTTGPGATNTLAIVSGFIQPSAAGTFAIRCASEVAVASGLTIKVGSWLRIWETDN